MVVRLYTLRGWCEYDGRSIWAEPVIVFVITDKNYDLDVEDVERDTQSRKR